MTPWRHDILDVTYAHSEKSKLSSFSVGQIFIILPSVTVNERSSTFFSAYIEPNKRKLLTSVLFLMSERVLLIKL